MICIGALIHRIHIVSEGIRQVTGSFYNHAAIIIYLFGKKYVIEAEYPRVRFLSYEKWMGINKDRTIHYTNSFEAKVNPLDMVGDRYFLGVFINRLMYNLFMWLYSLLKWLWLLKVAKWFLYRDKKHQSYCFQLLAKVMGLPDDEVAIGDTFLPFIIK